MCKLNCLIFIITFLFTQSIYAIVGYDKTEISTDSPVYYNTVALVKKIDKKYKVFCSANIASSDMVYTAKHCIEAVAGVEVFIYFGDDTNNIEPSLLRKILTRTVYTEIDLEVSFPSFDFGILNFEGGIPLSMDGTDRYKPVEVLTDPNHVLSADEYLVAGYGVSETSPKLFFGVKRRVKTNIRSYIHNAQFVSLLLLNGQEGEGTCHGDSGGPLYAKYNNKWYLAGVASGFDVGLTPGSYKVIDTKDNEMAPDCYGGESVYTFVGDYTNWVGAISNAEPMVSEASPIRRPGLDVSATHAPKSFSQWCKGTSYTHPAWETIRQLLYFAADAKSEYTADVVLSNCDIASEVLNTITEITFKEDSFFNDLSPLVSISSIKSLNFMSTKVPDLSVIPNGMLKSLSLSQLGLKSIHDVKGLLSLTSLSELNLTGNKIKNISDLKNFKSLNVLKLGSNKVSNISILKKITELEIIEIYSNRVSDITSILDLKKLKELLAANNQIVSPAKKANWPGLKMAILSNNKLINLGFLKGSEKIKRLRTFGNPLVENWHSSSYAP